MTDAEKILAESPAPNLDVKPGDGFKPVDPMEQFPVEMDAEGQPIKVDERLTDPNATLEPVGWVPVLTSDGKPVFSSKKMPLFKAPSDHRKFYVNEAGQAETVSFDKQYTAKEALRVFDLTEKTIQAEEQAIKNADAQRKADARRLAQQNRG